MHKTLFAFLLVIVSVASAPAQANPARQIQWPLLTGNGAPTQPCNSRTLGERYDDEVAHQPYRCDASGWMLGGTVTGLAGDVQGAGDGLVETTVVAVNRTPFTSASGTDQVPITVGSPASANWFTMPACTATGNVLRYNTTLHTFTCPALTLSDVTVAMGNAGAGTFLRGPATYAGPASFLALTNADLIAAAGSQGTAMVFASPASAAGPPSWRSLMTSDISDIATFYAPIVGDNSYLSTFLSTNVAGYVSMLAGATLCFGQGGSTCLGTYIAGNGVGGFGLYANQGFALGYGTRAAISGDAFDQLYMGNVQAGFTPATLSMPDASVADAYDLDNTSGAYRYEWLEGTAKTHPAAHYSMPHSGGPEIDALGYTNADTGGYSNALSQATIVATLQLSSTLTPHGLALGGDGRLYATLQGSSTVDGAIAVVDLASNPAAPTLVGTVPDNYPETNGIVESGGYLFTTNYSGPALETWNVNGELGLPTYVGCGVAFNDAAWSSCSQIANNTPGAGGSFGEPPQVYGNHVYYGFNSDDAGQAVQIFDATNPLAPVLANPYTWFTGVSFASGSTTLTFTAQAGGPPLVGQVVTATGVASGTSIAAIGSGTLTLSAPTLAASSPGETASSGSGITAGYNAAGSKLAGQMAGSYGGYEFIATNPDGPTNQAIALRAYSLAANPTNPTLLGSAQLPAGEIVQQNAQLGMLQADFTLDGSSNAFLHVTDWTNAAVPITTTLALANGCKPGVSNYPLALGSYLLIGCSSVGTVTTGIDVFQINPGSAPVLLGQIATSLNRVGGLAANGRYLYATDSTGNLDVIDFGGIDANQIRVGTLQAQSITAGKVKAQSVDAATIKAQSLSAPVGGDLSGDVAAATVKSIHATGGTIDGTVIGGTTPAALTATTIATNEFSLRATSGPTLLSVGENAGAPGYAGTQVTGAAVGGTGVNFIYGEWAGQYGIWNNAVGGAPLRLDLNAPGNSMYLQKDGSFTTPFATAPTGACPVSGSWAFSQDGHASFCSGGTWVVKI